MPTRFPQALTRTEQTILPTVTTAHPRDHLTFGTGLRLAGVVGLDAGDVYSAATSRGFASMGWHSSTSRGKVRAADRVTL